MAHHHRRHPKDGVLEETILPCAALGIALFAVMGFLASVVKFAVILYRWVSVG